MRAFLFFCLSVPLLAEHTLTNADIVRMVKEQVPEVTIREAIQASAARYDTTPAAQQDLLHSGVNEGIIKAMAARQRPAGISRSFDGVKLLGARTTFDVDSSRQKNEGRGPLRLNAAALEMEPSLKIPLESVTGIVYERAAKPRYALGLLVAWPLLFTKGKQHYLTVQHQDGYALFRLPKGKHREIVAALEAATGHHAEWHEER